jgi:hypothetical protein
MSLNLPHRQRWLLIAAGIGVGLLIIDNVVVEPLSSTWTAHAAEIGKLRNEVADGNSTIARGPRLQQTWSDMQRGALPRDQAQAEHDVISGFETWSRSSGVELGAVKPIWKHGATDAYSVLELRVDASGQLGSLTRFIYELERAPMALRVESVELISRDDSGQRLTLSLIVTGLKLSPLEGKS